MRMLMHMCNADVTAAHHFTLISLQSLYHQTCSDLALLSLQGLGTVLTGVKRTRTRVSVQVLCPLPCISLHQGTSQTAYVKLQSVCNKSADLACLQQAYAEDTLDTGFCENDTSLLRVGGASFCLCSRV